MYSHSARNRNTGYRHPFLFGILCLGGVGDVPRTLTELAMCQLSAQIRKQQDWWKRCNEESARTEWRKLNIQTVKTPASTAEIILSEEQVNYVMDELTGYATLRDEVHNCQVSCFDRIWESDNLLPSATIDDLLHHIRRLESLPTCTRSNDGQTINFIDPMLHCLVYDKTLVSLNQKDPTPIPIAPNPDNYTLSTPFAFLPSDISIPSDISSNSNSNPNNTSTVKFLSYINNLHSEDQKPLYKLFETTLTSLIPLFTHVLTDLHRNNPLPQRIPGRSKYTTWDEPDTPEHSDDDEGWNTYEHNMRQWVLHRPIQLPDVSDKGYIGGLEDRKFNVSLGGKRLQVIVEALEIRLRPQSCRESRGTSWNVKGMRNERIVACAIQCLAAENITPVTVQFRMAVTYPRGFAIGDTGATLRTWGIQDGDPCHQYIGQSKPLQPNYTIVFPNIYQHRISPFTLSDTSTFESNEDGDGQREKEGKLSLLIFYLIDPDIKPIISTIHVPPQQRDWICRVLEECLCPRLPTELVHLIFNFVEGLMSIEEAENQRKDFLDLQKRFRETNNNYHFCIPFDIWNGPDFLHSNSQ